MSPEFLFTSLVVVATPGTGVILTLAAGLSRGAGAAVLVALGCTLGIVPHVLAAVTGLAALLQASAVAFEVLRYGGVGYLLWIAWTTLSESGPLQVGPDRRTHLGMSDVVAPVVANLLNPKLSIFFLAFLPQFVAADDPQPLRDMLTLSLAFMAMTFAVFVIYGLGAAAFRERVGEHPVALTWLRRILAGSLIGLALRLALAER